MKNYFLKLLYQTLFTKIDEEPISPQYSVANGDLNPNCVPMADFYFENDKGHFQDKASFVGLNDYGIGRG